MVKALLLIGNNFDTISLDVLILYSFGLTFVKLSAGLTALFKLIISFEFAPTCEANFAPSECPNVDTFSAPYFCSALFCMIV